MKTHILPELGRLRPGEKRAAMAVCGAELATHADGRLRTWAIARAAPLPWGYPPLCVECERMSGRATHSTGAPKAVGEQIPVDPDNPRPPGLNREGVNPDVERKLL